MPTPTAYNTGPAVSGSIQQNNISYVVDGQNRNYRDGFGGLNWISEVPPSNNLVFVGNTTSIGRGPAGFPVFYPTLSTSSEDILNTLNKLPGSPGNFENTGSGYVWALNNNFFINNANQPFGGIVADGLVLYSDAGKITSYPTTASTWYDLSGNNNIFSLFNGPSFNPNGYITTDGVNDFLSSTNPQSISNISGSDPFTFSALFKLTQYANQRLTDSENYSSLLMKGSFSPSFGISLRYSSPLDGVFTRARTYSGVRNTILPITASGYGNAVQTSNTDFILNRWYQVDFTSEFSGTTYTFKTYVNGNLDATSTSTLSTYPVAFQNNSNLTLASSPLGGTGINAPINISKGVVYNKSLSQAEILQNYYQAPIVTSGLVLAVDAGNLVSYESGSATTYQLTGSVNSGSLNNGVTFSPNAGGTWGFDGTDDFINFGNSTPINFIYTDPFSLEAWFNPNALSDFKHIIGKTFGNYRLAQNENAISFRLDSNKMAFQTSAVLTVGKWTHVIATWEPSTFTGRIYIDGILAATSINTNINWTNTTANFQIGNSPGENYYFNGNIALGRAYNRTLSAQEISQNFNAQISRFILNNNVSKILAYSIVNYWTRSGENNYDNGSYTIYLKENPEVMLFSQGGYQGTLIYNYTNPEFQNNNSPACIVDVTVSINSDNSKTFMVGDFKPNSLILTNNRPNRTEQYYIDIISPYVPLYNEIF
jgi:hypothetical protein